MPEITAALLSKNAVGPLRRNLRQRTVVSDRFRVHGHFVVISPDHSIGVLAHPLDDVIGIRAVAHQIAQADDLVVAPLGVVDYSFKCFAVRVKVA